MTRSSPRRASAAKPRPAPDLRLEALRSVRPGQEAGHPARRSAGRDPGRARDCAGAEAQGGDLGRRRGLESGRCHQEGGIAGPAVGGTLEPAAASLRSLRRGVYQPREAARRRRDGGHPFAGREAPAAARRPRATFRLKPPRPLPLACRRRSRSRPSRSRRPRSWGLPIRWARWKPANGPTSSSRRATCSSRRRPCSHSSLTASRCDPKAATPSFMPSIAAGSTKCGPAVPGWGSTRCQPSFQARVHRRRLVRRPSGNENANPEHGGCESGRRVSCEGR